MVGEFSYPERSRKSLSSINKRIFEEHLCEFHLCESTFEYYENSELNFLFLECAHICFERLLLNNFFRDHIKSLKNLY